jgi:hypothetical protein
MLTKREVASLLAVAATFDRRRGTVGEVDVEAWTAAAHVGRWTFDAAVEAVKAHYAESTENLMPAHITQRLRGEQRQPARYGDTPRAIQGPTAATAEQRAAAMRKIAETIGTKKGRQPDVVADDRAALCLDVECPHCHALQGVRCTGHRGTTLTKSPCHPSRAEASALAAGAA